MMWTTPLIKDTGPCLLWQGSFHSRTGYGQVYDPNYRWLKRGKFLCKGKMVEAHRKVWQDLHGPIPNGFHVLHYCDNRKCVNDGHLYLGTNQDNIFDKTDKGRAARGQAITTARLTETQVLSIYADRRTHREIAAQYGVSRPTVTLIKTRKTWAWLTGKDQADA